MRTFIIKTQLFAFPLLLLLILVNYFGDAAKLFDNGYEKRMAEIVNNGKNATNISNYDERLFQKEMIHGGAQSPDIAVIGSSRSMLINSELFSPLTVINNSVSGATIEDLTAIYQIYKENNKVPKKIIIGVDPWIFNENNGQKRWKSIAEYYYRFHHRTNKISIKWDYKELISLSYFQSSIKLIPPYLRGDNEPKPSTLKYNETNTKLVDGSMGYGYDYRMATEEQIESKMKLYIADKIYGIENYEALSSRIISDFEKLTTDMKMNRIEIELFLAPYPPLVYDEIKSKYPMVPLSEEWISNFATQHQIKIYGSFNPDKPGLDKSFFYDGMHCKEAAIKKIFRDNY